MYTKYLTIPEIKNPKECVQVIYNLIPITRNDIITIYARYSITMLQCVQVLYNLILVTGIDIIQDLYLRIDIMHRTQLCVQVIYNILPVT